MRLVALRINGFARLTDRDFAFAPGLNVVFGPNESGKSTLANAIVATLYGAERKKDAWRPWSGAPYTTTLTYELRSGERIEIQRDFDRDAKGLRVYDRSGNDIAAQLGAGKRLVPGEAHLGIPLEVFVNAACVKQQAIAIDDGKDAAPIAAHLARALDGGPREDAALGAIGRLDDALRIHVGTARASKNAPLRKLREQHADEARAVAEARARLDALGDLRERIERAALDRERAAGISADIERRARAVRAAAIAKRLSALREFRAELAELQADRAAFDDVAGFPAEREPEANEAFYRWEAAERVAANARLDAEANAMSDAEREELASRRADAGSLDDDAFSALQAAGDQADAARLRASAAANEAAAARRSGEPGGGVLGAVLAAGALALCVAIGFAIAHDWLWTAVALAVAIAVLSVAFAQAAGRARRRRDGDLRQRAADDALAAERIAAATVAQVLGPLGIVSIDELVRRRTRLAALEAKADAAERSEQRDREAQAGVEAAALHFDRIADALVGPGSAPRPERKAAINARAARKRERDGLDSHLSALEMRKSTILGSDDEFALEAELGDLLREGVEPVTDDSYGTARQLEAERGEAAETLRLAGEARSRLDGELQLAEAQTADVAALDEALARTAAEIARLEAFERAVSLAKTTLETRTKESHQAFARRLEDYASSTLGTITAGRYGEIFVDPATFAIKVRVPETGAIEPLELLSAGTRDQAYLVVRFAMARMFAEGFETPPLLLDDPFAYWDTARIERCLPVIELGALDAQAILFTSSEELARTAAARGANRIDLSAPVLIENSA